MALEGSSKNFPICLSDSSPISVPASPVKLLTEERKRDKCRYEARLLNFVYANDVACYHFTSGDWFWS